MSWTREVAAVERASALVVEDVAVVPVEDDALVGLDTSSGDERWRWRAPGELLDEPLVAAGGLVAVVVPNLEPAQLCAVAAEDGVEHWCVDDPAGVLGWAPPMQAQLAGDPAQVVVTGRDGVARSFDTADGSLRWERELEPVDEQEPVAAGAVVITPGAVVVGSGARTDGDERGEVAGLDPDTGEEMWRRPATIGPVWRHRLAADDDEVVVHSVRSLWLLDAVTGTEHWEATLPPPPAGTFTEPVAFPALVGDLVLVLPLVTWAFPQESGVLFALERDSGEVRWSVPETPLLAHLQVDFMLAGLGAVDGSPALLGEDLSILDPDDGTVLSTVELGLSWGQRFAAAGGQVFTVDPDGTVVAVEPDATTAATEPDATTAVIERDGTTAAAPPGE